MGKEIRFIDSRYKELFRLPDGGWVKIEYPRGETLFRQCAYMGETHVKVGSNVYHICQFAELMEQAHARYTPAGEPETVRGYMITDKQTVGLKVFALAHNPDAVEPYVTWQGRTDTPGYDLGHYFSDSSKAYTDYMGRSLTEQDWQASLRPPSGARKPKKKEPER